MTRAICIFCGAHKKKPFDTCHQCNYSPRGDDPAMAKSLMLSNIYRDEEGKPYKSDEELAAISESIRNGRGYNFDAQLLAELVEEKKILDSLPKSVERKFVIFGLCFIIIPLLAIIIFIVKHAPW